MSGFPAQDLQLEPRPSDIAAFRRESAEQIVHGFRRGGPAAVLVCLAISLALPVSYPELSFQRLVLPTVVAMALLLVGTISMTLGPVRRNPLWVLSLLSAVIVSCAAFTASQTGGFASPFFAVLFLTWIFGSSLLPFSALDFVLASFHNLPITYLVISMFSPEPGSALLPTIIALGGQGYCVLAAHLRDRASLRAYLVRRRLDEANRSLSEKQAELAQINQELEQRVELGLEDLLRTNRDLKALSAQLQVKVQARARELALALQQEAGDFDGQPQILAKDFLFEDRVRIERRIGSGGMGVVYLGHDCVTATPVALKLMHPHAASRETLARFLGEAAATAAVSHPGIVRVLHVDATANGELYLLMEYVEGTSLERVLSGDGTPPGVAARIAAEVASALAAAHAVGVVHRDIKPSNILVCATAPGVKIVDFGVSKVLSPGLSPSPALTTARQLVGTPDYMSPEQVRDSSSVGPATDVFSLGVVLFQMLTGHMPFTRAGASPFPQLAQAPRDLTELGDALPNDLLLTLNACLARDPELRPSAAELATTLRAVADRLAVPPAEELVWRRASESDSDQSTLEANSETLDSGVNPAPAKTATSL